MENIILVVLLVILLVALVITAEKPLVLSEKDWWRKARKPEPRCRSPPTPRHSWVSLLERKEVNSPISHRIDMRYFEV